MLKIQDIKSWEDAKNKVLNCDCLEYMPLIADKSIDMILCDLPYGTTACHWDTIIPFEPLWEHYKRIIKDNGAIVLTASQPFTSALVMSNVKMFKYEWVWEKKKFNSGFVHAKNKPLKKHENILVFSGGTTVHKCQSLNRMEYNPQGLLPTNKLRKKNTTHTDTSFAERKSHRDTLQEYTNYPKSIISFDLEGKPLHPTQKPVALFEYLIKTYTNEGDLVLDNCAGSFTTAVACNNLKRNWICVEKEEKYCLVGEDRLKQEILI